MIGLLMAFAAVQPTPESLTLLCTGQSVATHSSLIRQTKTVLLEMREGKWMITQFVSGEMADVLWGGLDYSYTQQKGHPTLSSDVSVTPFMIQAYSNFRNDANRTYQTRSVTIDRVSGRIEDMKQSTDSGQQSFMEFKGVCHHQSRQF